MNWAKNDSFVIRPNLSSKNIEQIDKLLWEVNWTNVYTFKSSSEMMKGLDNIGFPKKKIRVKQKTLNKPTVYKCYLIIIHDKSKQIC